MTVSNEMIERAWQAYWDTPVNLALGKKAAEPCIRAALESALTPPADVAELLRRCEKIIDRNVAPEGSLVAELYHALASQAARIAGLEREREEARADTEQLRREYAASNEHAKFRATAAEARVKRLEEALSVVKTVLDSIPDHIACELWAEDGVSLGLFVDAALGEKADD